MKQINNFTLYEQMTSGTIIKNAEFLEINNEVENKSY